MNIIIRDVEYELATTLRVAYNIQGQHNHKPYSEIFEQVGEMGIEDQVGIIWAAFQAANPDMSKIIGRTGFTDDYLDRYNLTDLMNHLKGVVEGILGKSMDDKQEQSEAEDENFQKEPGMTSLE